MLTRLMMRFGTPEPQAAASLQASRTAPSAPDRAQLEKAADGVSTARASTTASTARGAASASRSTASASPSSTATGRRARTSSATPIPRPTAEEGQGLPRQADVLEGRRTEKPEQYRITVAQADPRSVVTVQDPDGAPDKSADRREDPRAAQGPAQVAARRACASRPWAAAARATASSSKPAAPAS